MSTADTIEQARVEPTTICASVNERKLLSSLGHMFTNSVNVLAELMQNARRANATEVRIDLIENGQSLQIEDNGDGIDDFCKLVELCDSGWSDKVLAEDSPYGMGFFSTFFACAVVEVTSHGKSLSLSLTDIQNKKQIVIRPSDLRVPGTRIVLRELKPDLRGPNGHFRLSSYLERYAAGFPLTVHFGGAVLANPLAENGAVMRNAEATPIGRVAVKGIHFDQDNPLHETVPSIDNASVRCFLQGLPIGVGMSHFRSEIQHPQIVVHLNPALFFGRMPDRDVVIDADIASAGIRKVIRAIYDRVLVELSTQLTPEAFVTHYWQACMARDLGHLLSGIPFIPERLIPKISSTVAGNGNSWSDAARESAMSMQSVRDLCVPIIQASTDDPRYADGLVLEALQVAQACDWRWMTANVPEGHWILEFLTALDDLVIDVAAVNPVGGTQFQFSDLEVTLAVELCERVDVTITSLAGSLHHTASLPSFGFSPTILESVLSSSGRPPTDQLIVQCKALTAQHAEAVLYVGRECDGWNLVEMFSDFMVDERVAEDWRERAADELHRQILIRRDASLATLLNGVEAARYLRVAGMSNMDRQMAIASVMNGDQVPVVRFRALDEAFGDRLANAVNAQVRQTGAPVTGAEMLALLHSLQENG